jgi:hypothetical protein
MSAQRIGGDGAGKQQEIAHDNVAATKRGKAVLLLCARPPVTTLGVPPSLSPHPMCHRITKRVPKNETGPKNPVTRHPHRVRWLPIFNTEFGHPPPTQNTVVGWPCAFQGLYDVLDLGQGTRRGRLCIDGAHEWQHHSWSRVKGRVCMCEQGVLDSHKSQKTVYTWLKIPVH